MTGRWKSLVPLVSCWLLGVVFVYAGSIKAWSPQPFADSIASFKLLPDALVNPLAMGLPGFEILAGLLCITPWRRVGALCILLMTGVFLIALVFALARGLTVDCGCFGTGTFDFLSPSRSLAWAIGRDLLIMTLAGIVYADALRARKA